MDGPYYYQIPIGLQNLGSHFSNSCSIKSLQGSKWPSGRKLIKTVTKTQGRWDCPIDIGPKLAVGQPNGT